jgi:hypothetical protein
VTGQAEDDLSSIDFLLAVIRMVIENYPSYLVMVAKREVIFAIICGFLGGLAFSFPTIDWFVARNAPIVSGHIISREPTRWLSIPRVDFTIRIDGSGTIVHARTQRGMMTKVPEIVRFHYTGDPTRNIFLFEQEMNPGWIVLFFWGSSLLLALSMRSTKICGMMGWNKMNRRVT